MVVADAAVGLYGPVGFPGATPPAHMLIDVKTGGGSLTPNQRVVYPKIGTPVTLIPVGTKALEAGYVPGIPIDVRTMTLEIPRYDANGNPCD
jgi:hypothetical protein